MSRNIVDLRESVFDTIDALKAGNITVDQAKAIAGLAQVIVSSAKVEADYIAAAESAKQPTFLMGSQTLEAPEEYKTLTTAGDRHPGYLGSTVHRIK